MYTLVVSQRWFGDFPTLRPCNSNMIPRASVFMASTCFGVIFLRYIGSTECASVSFFLPPFGARPVFVCLRSLCDDEILSSRDVLWHVRVSSCWWHLVRLEAKKFLFGIRADASCQRDLTKRMHNDLG